MSRAYVRMVPDLYERKAFGTAAHPAYPPAAVGAFVGLLCLAEQQSPRGRFKNRRVLQVLLEGPHGEGRAYAKQIGFLIEQGDLVVGDDGSLYVEGWDELQEGRDPSVDERMRRYRDRKRAASHVTSPSPSVTSNATVNDALETRKSRQEPLAVKRLAVKRLAVDDNAAATPVPSTDDATTPTASTIVDSLAALDIDPPKTRQQPERPASNEPLPLPETTLTTFDKVYGRFPNRNAVKWNGELVRLYGKREVDEAMAEEWRVDPDMGTLLGRTKARIQQMADDRQTKALDRAEQARSQAAQRQLDAIRTQRAQAGAAPQPEHIPAPAFRPVDNAAQIKAQRRADRATRLRDAQPAETPLSVVVAAFANYMPAVGEAPG
jgi:hypothetical protein